MKSSNNDSPTFITYVGAAISTALLIYLFLSSFANSHGPSWLLESLVLIAALSAGLAALVLTSRILFPNDEKDANDADRNKIRIKMGVIIVVSMLASGSVAFVYFFLF